MGAEVEGCALWLYVWTVPTASRPVLHSQAAGFALFDRWLGSLVAMASDALPLSTDEFLARVRAGRPSTADDVSITLDGRRLDSKEAVLAWLADVEADRVAGRLVKLDND